MMKKGLFMVIALLAVSCLMAAGAYTSAMVSNAATLTVTSTSDSLVALTAKHVLFRTCQVKQVLKILLRKYKTMF